MANLKVEGNKAFWDKLKKTNGGKFKKKIIDEAGIRAKRFSKDRFRKKKWMDRTPQPWEKRKRKAKGSLMVQTGRLKTSIRILNKGKYYVRIGTDVPYAKIHNEGGKITKTVTVKSHNRKRSSKRSRNGSEDIKVRQHQRNMNTTMPQRQFLGSSRYLAKLMEYKMKKMFDKQLK